MLSHLELPVSQYLGLRLYVELQIADRCDEPGDSVFSRTELTSIFAVDNQISKSFECVVAAPGDSYRCVKKLSRRVETFFVCEHGLPRQPDSVGQYVSNFGRF